MTTDDGLPRRSLVTYRRSHRVDEEETVPDSEDNAPPGKSRSPDDNESGNLTGSSINAPDSDPPPPRAVYRSRKRAVSPPPLSYSSMAPAEEVIPDSEDNGKTADTSDDNDDDDTQKKSPSNARNFGSSGLSDWKQKLRDIDDQYNTDGQPQGPHEILGVIPGPKGVSSEDPFGSPLTTEASSQYHLRADEPLSSPSRGVASSTNTTPQCLFGTPGLPPSTPPTPPTSDGKPSPVPKPTTKAKGKGKARASLEAQEAAIDDQLASSPDPIRRTRRSEKPKKSKAPTKKELLEARRETARMRSDMRVSIPTDVTRHLDIKALLKRFDVNQPALPGRPLQPQSSVSEIEAWSSSSPVSVHEFGLPGIHQGESTETSQRGQHTSGRRSASPFRSTGLLAPSSKYKVAFAVDDDDDPFRVKAPSSAPEKTIADGDAGSGSDSDVEMPGIGQILAAKEARESLRTQKDRLQQFKVATVAKQQQMRESANAGTPLGVGDSDDDELDVVPDTMHSVAREEAAARAAAGHMRPLTGRTTQLRLAGIAASPQRNAAQSLIAGTTESPEKRMAAAAQPSFLASLKAGGTKRGAGMTKAELQRMMLHSAEAQSEQLRREKEEEWVRRGGRVVGVMEAVGEEKVQVLIGEALRRGEDPGAQGGADDDAGSDDDDDDADYIPMERGSASPQPTTSQDGEDEEEHMPAKEKMSDADEHPDDNSGIAEAAAPEEDSETESSAADVVRVHHRPGPARPRRTIIGSDDEDDGPSAARRTKEVDLHPSLLSLPDLPSPAFTSTASPWPTGTAEPDHNHEHENDPYVSGNETDKENRAVVRRAGVGSAPAHGARVLFDDILSARAGTRAAVQPLPPLQPSVLPVDDDPFAFPPSPAKAGEGALRRLASPTPRYPTGKRGLSQMFEEEEGEGSAPVPALVIQGGDGEGATPGDVDPGLVGFKPILGGLSQAFEETQCASGPGMGGLVALRRGVNTELSLTFEAQAAGLQPALEVDDSLRARAAAIFEKEQEYVMEAAQHAQPRTSRRELYITENGFLTQTRPEGSSPLVYRPSPSQRPYDALLRSQSNGTLGPAAPAGTGTAASSPLVARRPLSTLSETSPTSPSVMREPLRRLRRAHTSPVGPPSTSPRPYGYLRGQSQSPSPSPSPAKMKTKGAVAAGVERTAFTELMMAGATAQRDKAKAKKRSEFVEDQAVESDEDDMLGFGGIRKKGGEDDDDDDEQDTDGVVKALMDDAHMDEAALAKAKILEKHLEHQTEDDARLEKEVQDVVAGKRRTKRRGGAGGLLGSDESDEEDDEEARALRRRLAKKRRVAGDTLDALARDPATASFHATYQMALVDDDEEFAHLDRDEELELEPDRDGEQERGEEDDGGEERDEDEDGQQGADEDVEMAEPSRAEVGAGKRLGRREISAAEVRKALQEVARGEKEYHAIDPEDVSWMDQELAEVDEAEQTMRVRIASSTTTSKEQPRAAHPLHSHPTNVEDMDVVLSHNRIHAQDDERQDAAYAQRMKRWAREEGAGAGGSGKGAGSGRGGGRGTGTGTGVGGAGAGAAVTGHRPRAAKSTKSGASANKSSSSAAAAAACPPVRKTASALSAVADRRGRFGV